MRLSLRYIALGLFLISAVLLIINVIYQDPVASVNVKLDYAKWFFYLGTIGFVISFKIAKSKSTHFISTIFAIIALVLSIAYSISLSIDDYRRIKYYDRLSEYYSLESCEDMQQRFERDLKNDELKYFTYNIHDVTKLSENLKSEYSIENFFVGDIVVKDMGCYNALVEKYLRDSFDVDIKMIE